MDPSSAKSQVQIPHEFHIPVARHRFLAALAGAIEDPGQRQLWQSFSHLLESVYHFRYHTVGTELKEDFLLFDTRQGDREMAHLSAEEVAHREIRFLRNFVDVMQRGNFRPLTQADVELAEEEDYLFTLPVSVAWDRLDDGLLSRFWEQHPPQEADLPDFARRILVFQRGVGVEQSFGFHVLAKIDILVGRLFGLALWLPRKLLGRNVTVRRTPAAATNANQPDTPRTHKFNDRFVERIPLRATGRGLGWLCQRTLIQEPTFQELVILYRPATLPPRRACDPIPPQDHTIRIKAFNDIPMADLEVVFPEKRISMKPLDLAKLGTTGLIGFVMVATKVVVQAALNPLLALAALGTMAGYASKVLMGFKVSRDRYQHVVTTSLYDKNRDNDLGVIFYLMDSLEEQELKEALLAYYILWRDGTLQRNELDARCEEFLFRRCGVEVDFEVGDALDKLQREELVVVSGTYCSAVPLDAALARLDEHWDNYFQFSVAK